jgi:RNA polymerase sigma-70 factor (ECF subfamily)
MKATLPNDLLVRIAQGDQKAFEILYTHFYTPLLSFGQSLIHSKELTEEVIEDVFVKLWLRRAEIEKIENVAVYLYVAVKNKALNLLSSKAKELIHASFDYLDLSIQDPETPLQTLVTSEMMQRMKNAIDSLPPKCKMIFKLVREDGLKYKEVSQILNISVNTIDAQMAIAVKRICMALKVQKPAKENLLKKLS